MILLLFLGSALSQSCINLDANSPCGPSFQGAPVAFSTIDQFLSNMEVFANVSSTRDEINRVGTCNISNDDALKQQYQSSFFCAFMIDDALINNGCSSVAPFVIEKTKLCSNICNAAKNSISKTLSSCQNPRNIMAGLDSFCSKSTSSDQGSCFAGIKSEIDVCGFRTREAAQIGCPTLREDELDAECCKKLIPGVALLPAEENKQGVNMAVAIGIAIGVAAFLILAALLASIVWLATPKKLSSSKHGNSILKDNSERDSFSSLGSSTYSNSPGMNIKKPVEFEQKMLSNPSTFEFQDGPQIRMENPYQSSVKIDKMQYLSPPTFNRDSMMSKSSGSSNTNRQTIDLDLLDFNGIDEEQVTPEQYLSNSSAAHQPSMNASSDMDSVSYMRNGAGAQSIYSNILREQLTETDTVRDSEVYDANSMRKFESLYSMSTDKFIDYKDSRDSALSINFPQPPNNPPITPKK